LKILLAPDKFKDSLSATKVCEALAFGINKFDLSIEIVSHPLADGGEGTLNVLESNLNLKRVGVIVNDPFFRPIKAYFLKDKDTAFIEMAEASGLQRLKLEEYNPAKASTYGTGELIKHAINSGVKNVNLFIGGSATNDGGIGMAAALGYKFIGEDGVIQKPVGKDLYQILAIDDSKLNTLIKNVRFTVLTDVQNKLYGKNGATLVYGTQKGADEGMLIALDDGLKHLAGILKNGMEDVSGAGAAGGLGYGAMVFLKADIKSGIEYIMKVTKLKNRLLDVDLVITGEGKFDNQSLEGKVVGGVLSLIQQQKKPVALVCGSSVIELDEVPIYQIMDFSSGLRDAKENAFIYLKMIGELLVRDFIETQTY